MAGTLILDGATAVHRVQFYTYDTLDLGSYSAASIGSAKLRAGLTIPPELIDAPGWFTYFSRDI